MLFIREKILFPDDLARNKTDFLAVFDCEIGDIAGEATRLANMPASLLCAPEPNLRTLSGLAPSHHKKN